MQEEDFRSKYGSHIFSFVECYQDLYSKFLSTCDVIKECSSREIHCKQRFPERPSLEQELKLKQAQIQRLQEECAELEKSLKGGGLSPNSEARINARTARLLGLRQTEFQAQITELFENFIEDV